MITVTGCAYPIKSDFYTKPERVVDKSIIYLYRTKTSIDSMNPDVPTFYVNGQKLGKLMIGGYYRAEVKPGLVEVYYRDSLFGIPMFRSPLKVKFTADENQVYYVKFSIESIMRTSELQVVPNSIGEQEIKTTQLLVK